MSIQKDRLYSKSHEWIQFSDDTTAKVGITEHAAEQLGDLVYLTMPEVGDGVTVGDSIGDIESVKTVSDLCSPITGTVSAVNEEALDDPAKINESPYDIWMIEVSGITDKEELLDADAYEALVAAEG